MRFVTFLYTSIGLTVCLAVIVTAEESIPKSSSYSLNEFESDVKKLKAHGRDLELSENGLSSLRKMFAHCTKLNIRYNDPSYELIFEPKQERAMNMKFKSGEPFKYAFLTEPAEAVYTVSGNTIIGNETLETGGKFEVEITLGDELVMTRKSKDVSLVLKFSRLGITANSTNKLIPKAATYIVGLYGNEVVEELKEHAEDIGLKSVYKDALVDTFKPMSFIKVKNTHPHYLIQIIGIPNDGLQFNTGEPFEYFAFGKTTKAFYVVSGNKIHGKEILRDASGHTVGDMYEVEFVFVDNGNSLVMTRKSETATVKISFIKSLI